MIFCICVQAHRNEIEQTHILSYLYHLTFSELQYMLVQLGFVVCLYTYCGGQKINPYIMAYISFLLALKRCSVVFLSFSYILFIFYILWVKIYFEIEGKNNLKHFISTINNFWKLFIIKFFHLTNLIKNISISQNIFYQHVCKKYQLPFEHCLSLFFALVKIFCNMQPLSLQTRKDTTKSHISLYAYP